jgi:hypothetical protein
MNPSESSVAQTDAPVVGGREGVGADPPRFTFADVQAPARMLGVLRWSDYVLVVGCGFGCLAVLPEAVKALFHAQLMDAAIALAIGSCLGFGAYTGWRHVGVIDGRVWRAYIWVFPLLIAAEALTVMSSAAALKRNGIGATGLDQLLPLVSALWVAGVSLPGFVCVVLLRRVSFPTIGLSLPALLERLVAQAGGAPRLLARVPRSRLARGIAYATLGVLVLIVVQFLPLTDAKGHLSVLARSVDQLTLFGFFLVVRARRYFQPDANTLLAADKRAPILFLRAFEDDEKQKYARSRRELLDFSLETRLANHFSHFGPFIAVGSPREPLPEPGAARAQLGDDEWQSRVVSWMREANAIVMYGGKTDWVNWELGKVIENGRATRLILMFPELGVRRSAKRRKDIASRVDRVRAAFRSTPWNEELAEFAAYDDLRAMLFQPDGSVLMIRSRSRSREAYHLAALVAHLQMIEAGSEVRDVQARGRRARWIAPLVGAVAMAAAVVAAVVIVRGTPHFGTRLSYGKGELFYKDTVTREQAAALGVHLQSEGFFSYEHANSVEVERIAETYRVHLVVDAQNRSNPDFVVRVEDLGANASAKALGGAPVEIALCDSSFQPIEVLPRIAKLTFGRGELAYTTNLPEQTAVGVGKELVAMGFFDDNPKSVWLTAGGDTTELRFIVDPSRASAPEIVNGFKDISRAVAKGFLADRRVIMRLSDPYLTTVRSEPLER